MAEEKKNRNEKEMPFLDHLEELRWRLIKCIVAVVVSSIILYAFFANKIMWILTRPFPEKLIFLAPTEGFMIYIKISIFAGIIVSLPIIFYQLWQFIAPGLFEKERKYVSIIITFSTVCFLAGATFCYFLIIPFGLKFLLDFQTETLKANITIKEYLSFVTTLILVFGLVFELPLLSLFLTKIGILTPEFLKSNRRYSIVAIFILAAVLTPTTDVFTQLMLAGPLIILYEISIWISKATVPKKVKRE